jgi:preprotein translocase YajC subunit
MKPGHKVITIGGIHGEVTAVGETTVDIRVSDEGKGMVLTFNKGAVATNVTATAAAAPAAAK